MLKAIKLSGNMSRANLAKYRNRFIHLFEKATFVMHCYLSIRELELTMTPLPLASLALRFLNS